MTGPRVLVVTGRHRPHEVLLLAFSLTTGFAYTAGSPPPQSIVAAIAPWLVHAWSVGLLLSGSVGLLAVLLPLSEDRSLMLEFGAMLVGSGSLVVAAAAIFSYAGWRGAFSAGFCVFWAAANVVRAFQILRDLREVR